MRYKRNLKAVCFILVNLLLVTLSTEAAKLQIGSTYEEIKAVLGKPDGDLSAGKKRILTYGDAKVTLIDGKATKYSSGFNKLLAERNEAKDEVQAKRDSGLVNYKGEWVTPEESRQRQLKDAAEAAANEGSIWLTNFAQAKELAKSQDKNLLLNFTGSDWCGWCIKLEEEVFSKEAFLDEAKKSYVLVKLDFPRRTKLSQDLQKQNDALAKKYRFRGFPTIVVLNPNGKLHKTSGYVRGGPKAFLKSIR